MSDTREPRDRQGSASRYSTSRIEDEHQPSGRPCCALRSIGAHHGAIEKADAVNRRFDGGGNASRDPDRRFEKRHLPAAACFLPLFMHFRVKGLSRILTAHRCWSVRFCGLLRADNLLLRSHQAARTARNPSNFSIRSRSFPVGAPSHLIAVRRFRKTWSATPPR